MDHEVSFYLCNKCGAYSKNRCNCIEGKIMEIDKVQSALRFIKKGISRPELSRVLAAQNGLFATDLETDVHVKDTYGLNHGLHFHARLGSNELTCESLNSWPLIMSEREIENTVQIDAQQLKYLFKHSSKDETRPWLNGVAFQSGYAIATNGHTLKFIKTNKFVENKTYIVPRTSIDILMKFLRGFKFDKRDVTVKLTSTHAIVENDSFRIDMRLINRPFVKWRNHVPIKFENTVHVESWVNYIKYQRTLNKVNRKVVLKGLGGQLYLCGGTENNEELVGSYITEECEHHDFQIGFNCDLLELAREGKKEFEIKFNNDISPVSVNGVIVMPLKL